MIDIQRNEKIKNHPEQVPNIKPFFVLYYSKVIKYLTAMNKNNFNDI